MLMEDLTDLVQQIAFECSQTIHKLIPSLGQPNPSLWNVGCYMALRIMSRSAAETLARTGASPEQIKRWSEIADAVPVQIISESN